MMIIFHLQASKTGMAMRIFRSPKYPYRSSGAMGNPSQLGKYPTSYRHSKYNGLMKHIPSNKMLIDTSDKENIKNLR